MAHLFGRDYSNYLPPPHTHTHHPHTLQHIVDPHMVSASLDIAVNNPLSQADNVSRQLARRTSSNCFDVLIPRIFYLWVFYEDHFGHHSTLAHSTYFEV